jgi:SAM-dependent methyltransferase
MMKNSASTAIILLALVVGVGCSGWRGFGFRASGPEMPRLRQALALKPGMSVADVGAGRGELTVALAAEVGPGGQIFATDIETQALEQIRARVAATALRNVTVVQAHARDTGLPTHCCDAVVLRRVYHHLNDPWATNGDLLRALRPGGVLAIIDFPPEFSWLWPWPPNGVPQSRGGHGIAAQLVIDEVTASGFQLVQVIEDWPGRGPFTSYCVVFRKPRGRPRCGRPLWFSRLTWLRGLDLNQRPLGYEPFSNQDRCPRATNNASSISGSDVSGFGALWLSLEATSWVIPG